MVVNVEIPDKTFFKIGEAARLVGVEPHTLRYWEKEFRVIRPSKTKSNQRLFRQRDLQVLLVIQHLLHAQRFTIDGARKKLKELSAGGMTVSDMLDAIREGRPLDLEAADDEASKRRSLEAELAKAVKKIESLNATVAEQDDALRNASAADIETLSRERDALLEANRTMRERVRVAEAAAAKVDTGVLLTEEMRHRWRHLIDAINA
ncbi:MAG: DNA-binding transcriptional MerR regulator [Bradymonadia bacterium]